MGVYRGSALSAKHLLSAWDSIGLQIMVQNHGSERPTIIACISVAGLGHYNLPKLWSPWGLFPCSERTKAGGSPSVWKGPSLRQMHRKYHSPAFLLPASSPPSVLPEQDCLQAGLGSSLSSWPGVLLPTSSWNEKHFHSYSSPHSAELWDTLLRIFPARWELTILLHGLECSRNRE